MRLINTTTFVLQEFFENEIPSYAILSHTRGLEEVTYQDRLYVTRTIPPRWASVYLDDQVNKIKSMAGYLKTLPPAARGYRGTTWLGSGLIRTALTIQTQQS